MDTIFEREFIYLTPLQCFNLQTPQILTESEDGQKNRNNKRNFNFDLKFVLWL